MVANEGVGSDSEYKFQVLSPELICMTAGSISRASELVRIYKGYLKNNPLDPTTIEQQLRVPLTEIKERMSRQLIGGCFGMTLEKFDSNGERILGEESGRRRSPFRSEADQDSGGKPITYSGAKPISDSILKAISYRPPAEW
jgi:hypothetical protein